jgi:Holliday junction resolvase RusA-like endonuclease
MRVRNSEGVVISTAEMTKHTDPDVDKILESLFDAARRQVFKVDQTLDALLAEVEHLEPPS